jgi:glycerate-2-kinase
VDLRAILDSGRRACDAGRLLTGALTRHPVQPDLPVAVVAAGKAAQSMADAFARVHPGRIREV